jgi:hypothetical protein
MPCQDPQVSGAGVTELSQHCTSAVQLVQSQKLKLVSLWQPVRHDIHTHQVS